MCKAYLCQLQASVCWSRYEERLLIPAEQWSTHAFDLRLKNDHVIDNISESFNHWVGEHRVLNDVRDESRNCKLLVADQFGFEILDGSVHYVVNLTHRTCDCRVWDIRGIYCRHAALGIAYMRDNLEYFTDNMFRKERYMGAYSYIIHPIPELSFCPLDVDVNPINLKPPSVNEGNSRGEISQSQMSAATNVPLVDILQRIRGTKRKDQVDSLQPSQASSIP
ncbi:UNVERIFIED_CONTAM: hypothetical protein Slati_3687900 [Sesamum latifolium]|uniref:SWIM-type domain-containing protein n=1 Tax=Sesamum latifolium TaxID=2727402 RepID=A0AAW2U2B9_9LAMI